MKPLDKQEWEDKLYTGPAGNEPEVYVGVHVLNWGEFPPNVSHSWWRRQWRRLRRRAQNRATMGHNGP